MAEANLANCSLGGSKGGRAGGREGGREGWEGEWEGGREAEEGGWGLATEHQNETISGSPSISLTNARAHAHTLHPHRPCIFEPERWPEFVRLDLDVAQLQLHVSLSILYHFHPDERDLPTPLLKQRKAAPHRPHPAQPRLQP